MKANELMIGDWVLSKSDDKKYKINSIITQDDGTILLATEGGLLFDYMCEPIPLTAEILEKNGFEWRAYGIVLAGEDMALVQCGDYWKIKPNQDSNDTFCYIWYVHELQNSLRICDLEDHANNFKI